MPVRQIYRDHTSVENNRNHWLKVVTLVLVDSLLPSVVCLRFDLMTHFDLFSLDGT